MQKPISMLINEFRMQIEEAINDSGLPPVIIEPILSNYLLQVQGVAKQQSLNELKEYEESQKESSEKEE